MIDEKELRRLAKIQSDTTILNVYLNVDPTEHTSEEYLLSLRQMLKTVEKEAAPEDIAAVQRYFEHEYDWAGRGVILFSCAASDLWQSYTLAIPVDSGVTLARRPYLSPLAALMDTYGRYAVALVDRQSVRAFLFELGQLTHQETFQGEHVRKLKKGRGSSGGPGRRGGAPVSSRHGEKIALQNLQAGAKMVSRFCRRRKPQKLILAGAEPTVSQFRGMLPKSLQQKVIGNMGIDPGATEPQIRERSLEVLRKGEEERKKALVEAIFTAAAKGKEGVIGLDETLGAAHEGRIRTLIIDRQYRAPGYRCSQCNYLTTQKLANCPFCGRAFVEIPDAAEAVVSRVIEDSGVVEVIDRHPKLAHAGVGALLRY